jgi:hypothetical protein
MATPEELASLIPPPDANVGSSGAPPPPAPAPLPPPPPMPPPHEFVPLGTRVGDWIGAHTPSFAPKTKPLSPAEQHAMARYLGPGMASPGADPGAGMRDRLVAGVQNVPEALMGAVGGVTAEDRAATAPPGPTRDPIAFSRDSIPPGIARPPEPGAAGAAAALPPAIAQAYGASVAGGASAPSALIDALRVNAKQNHESFAREADAVERGTMSEAGAQVQQADVFAKQAQDLQAEKEANAAAEAKHQADRAAQIEAIKTAQADASSQKIDPDHFYSSKSTGQKIALRIGAFLGGLGASLTHGTNEALASIQQQINNDIGAQKANIDQKWQGVKAHQDVLSSMEKAGVDRRNADIVKRGLMLDAAKSQVEQYMAGSKSADVQQRGAQLVEGLQRADAANSLQAQVMTAAAQRPVGGAPGGAKPGAYGAKTASGEDERYVPGAGGYAKDKESATRLNALTESTANIEDLAHRMMKTRDDLGVPGRVGNALADKVGYETESHAQLAQDQVGMQLQLKNLYQLGAISESDSRMLDHLVGDPNAILSDAQRTKLQGIIQSAKGARQNAFKAAGIQKVERGYATDQNGERHPVSEYTGANTSAGAAPPMPPSFKPAGS